MSRLSRKNWTADMVGLKSKGGMLDLFDNEVKSFLRITDDEMDYMCEFATDDELDLVTNSKLSFAEKRNLINLLNTKVYGKA